LPKASNGFLRTGKMLAGAMVVGFVPPENGGIGKVFFNLANVVYSCQLAA
jgi:hypothetical protein